MTLLFTRPDTPPPPHVILLSLFLAPSQEVPIEALTGRKNIQIFQSSCYCCHVVRNRWFRHSQQHSAFVFFSWLSQLIRTCITCARLSDSIVRTRTWCGRIKARLDYRPLFGKMSPHSSPRKSSLFGEDQRPDPGRETAEIEPILKRAKRK